MKKRLNTVEAPASKGCGGKEMKAKVGDLVKWLHDSTNWVTFGTVVEVGRSQFRVMWHEDFEDIEGYLGIWYDPEDWEVSMEKV